ncbi:MAG: hypothetical protein V1907_01195 [Candidatus Kerfeldbacteria bacterium]
MPRLALKDVLDSWQNLVEDFQTSTRDFYDSVEAGLKRRKIPGYATSRIDWSEGGVASAKREYLRISRGRFTFDVCAAPFGTGFFFSWWLVKRPARWVPLFLVGFLALWYALELVLERMVWALLGHQRQMSLLWSITNSSYFPIVSLVIEVLLAFILASWLLTVLSRGGWDDPEEAILAVPILGWVYERFFAPETYWKLDTAMMFRSTADAAVREAADALLTAKGLRALTANEQRPVFSKLL